ncbi:ATPase, T2SS/T4P/T4SS family [Ruegeria atlantica]|uniref:ATPase, T2SS/T4P/T4SS family n=1 Tax=Ruegeria atlantica TaxID=81569 RepID=UPI0020C24545|nr:ATPase, T2SS/T4P/T4SS family [Ruegeria atlantica]
MEKLRALEHVGFSPKQGHAAPTLGGTDTGRKPGGGMQMMARLVSLFGTHQKPLPVLQNGVFDHPDPEFRRIGAARNDGICFVARGYRNTDAFLEPVLALVSAGMLSGTYELREWPLEDIPSLYDPNAKRRIQDESRSLTERDGEKRLVNTIAAAAKARASDIKIFRHDTKTLVRFKIAGSEYDFGHPWTAEEGKSAINMLFNSADGGSGESTLKKETNYSMSISPGGRVSLPENVVKLRLEIGYFESDAREGKSAVMRVFYGDDNDTGALEDLGYDRDVYRCLARARANLRGCVILGGETGDGKSTTLIRALEAVYDSREGRKSIVTFEDPVEYRIRRNGITQIPRASASRGSNDDEKALRSFMRQNPDVLMLSEIRERGGGELLLQFAMSGHGAYSTLHVDNANAIPFRLIAMGISPEDLSQAGQLRLLIKQTLVPLLCDHCKTPMGDARLTDDERFALEDIEDVAGGVFLRDRGGCQHCLRDGEDLGQRAWAGYQRQIAVAEVIEPDLEYTEYVRARHFNGALKHWLKPRAEGGLGGITLSQKVTELVMRGHVDPRDALDKKTDLSDRMDDIQRKSFIWSPEGVSL